jgi:hypothetical protein
LNECIFWEEFFFPTFDKTLRVERWKWHFGQKIGPGGGMIKQQKQKKLRAGHPAFFGNYSSIAKNHTRTNQITLE